MDNLLPSIRRNSTSDRNQFLNHTFQDDTSSSEKQRIKERFKQNKTQHLQRRLSILQQRTQEVKDQKEKIKQAKYPTQANQSETTSSASSSNDSDVQELNNEEIQKMVYEERNKIGDQIIAKHQLNVARKKTIIAVDRNDRFKELMRQNAVIIFPELNLHAWDRLPRFTFLDVDLKQPNQDKVNKKSERKHKPVKSKFVGSPVRPPSDGGVLTATKKNQRQRGEDDMAENARPQTKTTGDASFQKNLSEFNAQMNDIGMNRVRDKIPASYSIALSKAQRTRQAFIRDHQPKFNDDRFKQMQEEMRSKSSCDSQSHNLIGSTSRASVMSGGLVLTEQVLSAIEQQRKKLEIEIIKENYQQSVNRDILYICEDDLTRNKPVKDFMFQKFKERIHQNAAMSRRKKLQELKLEKRAARNKQDS